MTPFKTPLITTILLFILGHQAVAQSTVSLVPGTDLQKTVSAHPAGTTYRIKAGIHRLQQITPKDGDIFIGDKGAVLNGAQFLDQWRKEGRYWTHVIALDRAGQEYDACSPGYEACKFPEDLFKDDYFIMRVASRDQLSKDNWYLDYPSKKIYMLDDPTGFKMEISLARRAFGGSARGVTVRGLIVEKYAIPGHMAAIGDQYPGDAWTVEDNEVRLNHGQGIAFTGRATIRRNKVHHNGQLGIRSSRAKHALVEGNELSYNTVPEVGYVWSHEGGGAKFTVSDSLIIRNNQSHDNWGPGLWTDIDNTNTLYEGNICRNNLASGIFHEISFRAVIRCNTLSGNGKVHGSQILLSTSRDVEVYNNTLVVDKNSGEGIRVVQRNRGKAYTGINNTVHDNDITYSVTGKVSGAWADHDTDNFWKKGNNRFYKNRYHFPGTTATATSGRWEWNGNKMSWKDFQLTGQELEGSVDLIQPAKGGCR